MEKRELKEPTDATERARKKVCAFCMDKIEHIDYKDVRD